MKGILIIEPESQTEVEVILFLLAQNLWITVLMQTEDQLGIAHPRLDFVKIDYIVFKKLKVAMEGQNFLIVFNSQNKITRSHIENFLDAMEECHLNILIVLNEEGTETLFEMSEYLKLKEYSKMKLFNIANLNTTQKEFNFLQILTIIENH